MVHESLEMKSITGVEHDISFVHFAYSRTYSVQQSNFIVYMFPCSLVTVS